MMLKTLKRIAQAVDAADNLMHALSLVTSSVKDALDADACSLFLVDEEEGEYIFAATDGLNKDVIGKARLKLSEGLVGLVGEREEPINIDNAPTHENFHPIADLAEEEYMGFIGVPIIHRGELLGVLIVQQREVRHFAEEEEAFLVTLAIQVANYIAEAKAKGEMQSLKELSGKRRRKKTSTILNGVGGAPGVAIAKGIVVYPPADLDAVPDRPASDIHNEIQLFEQALVAAREEIQEIQRRAKSKLSVAENALFDAYERILESRSLSRAVEDEIRNGLWAQSALKRVIKQHVLHFESLDDSYMQERAADFRDLGRRILSHLQANKREAPSYPKNAILISEEVTATALMEMPQDCLVGVISGSGSSNSHVAILARALGLPTVMGVTGSHITQLAGKELIVDGYNGQVYVSPSASLKKEFRKLAEEEQQLDSELEALRELPAETTDGRQLALFVNTGLAVEGGLSLSVGAEGVGLYRTEMPFMLRDRFPSEEEQRVMYRQLLNTFAPRPVVMRTLDIGGDKNLPYFTVEEENPFLGWRGIRISLDHPEIFLQQVRAMLQASDELSNLSIMLPMISSVQEVETAQRLIQQAYDETIEEKIDIKKPAVGIMIEVPAAVYQAYELAKRVDFISVGSNDLIQYLLAVDRNNPHVADLYNSYHPAVLRALQAVAKAGHKAKRKVSICGELASDPISAVLLLGMGFDTLSMSARSLPRVKWVVRSFSYETAKSLVKEVLQMDDPTEVRCHMEMALDDAGVGGLIRAGR